MSLKREGIGCWWLSLGLGLEAEGGVSGGKRERDRFINVLTVIYRCGVYNHLKSDVLGNILPCNPRRHARPLTAGAHRPTTSMAT